MRSIKTAVYTAPAIAQRVTEFANDGNLPPVCVVENLDDLASAPIKYQQSSDGSTFTDIPGTTATINPGESNCQKVVASASRIALHVGGNLKVHFTVSRQVDGAPLNLGTA